jgi:hypothetical protein
MSHELQGYFLAHIPLFFLQISDHFESFFHATAPTGEIEITGRFMFIR